MKFKEGIVLGMAVYIGWSVAEAIDNCLVESKTGQSIIANAKRLMDNHITNDNKNENNKPEKNVIGFRMI